MKPATVAIPGRVLGAGQPCFVIAEAGVNHNGKLELARQLVAAAAAAGADAVKFQAFKTDQLVTPQAPKAEYQKSATGEGESQAAMLMRLELTPAMHRELMAECRRRGPLFLSSPFEEASADELLALGLPLLKIPSGELTNLPLLEHVAAKQTPVILSTGMASLGEVEQALEVFRAAGHDQVVLLHCVSQYPAPPADCNLRAMATLAAAFGLPVGFSDHTLGLDVALAAVALGACVLEKHFTLDRSLPGPDHQASLEPGELAALVEGVRRVEAALGDGRKVRRPGEENTAAVARKSLAARHAIRAGTTLTPADVQTLRPGTGLAPALLPAVLGRTAKMDIPPGTLLNFAMLA